MSPDRHQAAEYAHQCAANHADENQLAVEEDGLDEILVDDAIGDPHEEQREQATEHSLHQPIDEEGKADEHVGRADETHDRDLLGSGEHRHADGRADYDYRDSREGDAECDAGDGRDVAQAIEFFDPLLSVANIIDEVVSLDLVGYRLDHRRAPLARTQVNFDRRGKDAGLEYVGKFSH